MAAGFAEAGCNVEKLYGWLESIRAGLGERYAQQLWTLGIRLVSELPEIPVGMYLEEGFEKSDAELIRQAAGPAQQEVC